MRREGERDRHQAEEVEPPETGVVPVGAATLCPQRMKCWGVGEHGTVFRIIWYNSISPHRHALLIQPKKIPRKHLDPAHQPSKQPGVIGSQQTNKSSLS